MDEAGVGVMEDGSLCDCFQIITKDLNSISKDELLRDILIWDKLYKIYSGDLKIVFFSYHAETEGQQQYVEYKLTKTKNPMFKEFLQEKLQELKRVHDLYVTPGVALFFYGQNQTEYKNNYITIYTTLTKASRPLIRKMSAERKKRLFFQLCNKTVKQ